jgi:hypothetical protein
LTRLRVFLIKLGGRHPVRRKIAQLCFQARVFGDLAGFELRFDVTLKADLAHALHVAGTRAETEATEHMRDALLLAQTRSLRRRRLLLRARARRRDERSGDERECERKDGRAPRERGDKVKRPESKIFHSSDLKKFDVRPNILTLKQFSRD